MKKRNKRLNESQRRKKRRVHAVILPYFKYPQNDPLLRHCSQTGTAVLSAGMCMEMREGWGGRGGRGDGNKEARKVFFLILIFTNSYWPEPLEEKKSHTAALYKTCKNLPDGHTHKHTHTLYSFSNAVRCIWSFKS